MDTPSRLDPWYSIHVAASCFLLSSGGQSREERLVPRTWGWQDCKLEGAWVHPRVTHTFFSTMLTSNSGTQVRNKPQFCQGTEMGSWTVGERFSEEIQRYGVGSRWCHSCSQEEHAGESANKRPHPTLEGRKER